SLSFACWNLDYCGVDPDYPMGAPIAVIGSQADPLTFLYPQLYASNLLATGKVDLAEDVRIHEVRGLPHNWDEQWMSLTNWATLVDEYESSVSGYPTTLRDSGRMAPVVAAILDDMVDHVKHGKPLLPGHIDGRIAADGSAISYGLSNRLPGSAPSS